MKHAWNQSTLYGSSSVFEASPLSPPSSSRSMSPLMKALPCRPASRHVARTVMIATKKPVICALGTQAQSYTGSGCIFTITREVMGLQDSQAVFLIVSGTKVARESLVQIWRSQQTSQIQVTSKRGAPGAPL